MHNARGPMLGILLVCLLACAAIGTAEPPATMRASGFVFTQEPKETGTPAAQQGSAGFVFTQAAEEMMEPPADDGEAAAEETLAPEPTETPLPMRYGRTTISGINLRAEASAQGEPVYRIRNSGTYFVILETVDGPKETRWHLASLEEEGETVEGYVRADLVEELSELEYLQEITPVRVISLEELTQAREATPAPAEATAIPTGSVAPQVIATPRPNATSAPFVFQHASP